MTPGTKSGKAGSGSKGKSRASKGTGKKRPRTAPVKAGGRGSKASSREMKRSHLLPVLALWISVTVVLAGLIYWGVGGGPPKNKPTKAKKESHAAAPARVNHIAEPPKAMSPAKEAPWREPAPANQGRTVAVEPAKPVGHAAGTLDHEASPKAPEPGIVHEHSVPSAPPKPQTAEHKDAKAGSATQLASVSNLPVKPPPVRHPIPTPKMARIAIVIDDFGVDKDIAEKFLNIPMPVTFSVLPYQPHTKEIIELVHARGHEVILHVPMEPHGFPKVKPGRGALLLSMNGEGIRKTLDADIDSNPRIAGINNHMGSRFTENGHAMRSVLTDLQRRGMFFLDSYTSPKSVGYSLAKELKVPSLRRDVFLDDIQTGSAIKTQIDRLIQKAKIQGTAIAIGHPHPATLQVLSEEAPQFEKEGIAVVKLSELLDQTADR
jgi:polysaccharide deacetylase 2 family uncharacterized protein YibQ